MEATLGTLGQKQLENGMAQDSFKFKLHLQGKDLEGHMIDAKELGIALIGINDSLDLIAKQMPGPRQRRTSLQIQASLEKGSVIAHLQFIYDVVPVVTALALLPEELSMAKEAFECLILLVKLRKEYKDQEVTKDKVEAVTNQYVNCTIYNFSDNAKQVAQQIHNAGTIVKPLKEAFSPLGVGNHAERCEILDEEDNKILDLNRQDYSDMNEQSTQKDTMTKMVTSHIKVAVTGPRFDGKKWAIEFDGNAVTARMADTEFLAEIANKEVAFTPGMFLDIDLTQINGLKNGRMTIEYEISKVYAVSESSDLFS